MITALQFIAETRKLLGTPWIHEGRSERGVDCVGLIMLAGQRCGLDYIGIVRGHNISGVYTRKATPTLQQTLEAFCARTDCIEPGAIVLFKMRGAKFPHHLGLITDSGTIIHAESKRCAQVIEHGYRGHWLRQTDSIWRLPRVTYE